MLMSAASFFFGGGGELNNMQWKVARHFPFSLGNENLLGIHFHALESARDYKSICYLTLFLQMLPSANLKNLSRNF